MDPATDWVSTTERDLPWALDFAVLGQRVEVGPGPINLLNWTTSGEWTVMGWASHDTLPDTSGRVVAGFINWATDEHVSIGFRLVSGSPRLKTLSRGETPGNSTTVYGDNEWHQVVLIHNSDNTFSCYGNGKYE